MRRSRIVRIGTWAAIPETFSTSELVNSFHLASPKLTDRGLVLADSESTGTGRWYALRTECVPASPPENMVEPLAGGRSVELRGNDYVIRESRIGDIERIVHMGTTRHGDSDPGSLQGHSIGRWEDDVLIVETIFNSGETGTIVPGVPYIGTRVQERFALAPDRSRLSYSYSIENPDYLTLPVTGSAAWIFRP